MLKDVLAGLSLVVIVSGSQPADAQAPAPPPAAATTAPAPNDYANDATWLCRPGRQDACAIDLTTTVVAADGTLTREAFAPAADPPIDCFYVYPTVSTDATPNSDMTADPAEQNVVRQQLARFASRCRVFAPLYRQVTLAGLRAMLSPGGSGTAALAGGLGYDDVRDAFQAYLKRDNRGRGFVLVGHSQGSYVLMELIRREIDGKPLQKQLVSALLLGSTVPVAKGKDVGGAFQSVPLCRKPGQVGCVITYASFRSTLPPPASAMFGRVTAEAQEAGCTNPAALGGGSADLHAYLSAGGRTITSSAAPAPWVSSGATVDTPWVSVPGLLSAKCASNEHANYLEITVKGNPADPRVDDITGDLGTAGKPNPSWGLHLVDVNLAMGNLLDIVAAQSRTYAARR